ncbi:hypothetical protein [Bacillus pumilus]|uniref:hypothetical protein n=1 Tax=Bacillus pumilus TaxID=1408 RepID=UPI003D716F90
MAKKRLRKKKQAKQNIKKLKAVGVPEKEIKELKNKPDVVEKIYKQKKRKIDTKERQNKRAEIARERSRIIKGYGYKVSDYSSLRYVSEAKWNEWVKREERKKRQRERYRKNKSTKKLLLFWYEKTREYHDYEEIVRYKNSFKKETISYLIEQIRDAYLSDEGTLIGSAAAVATDDPASVKRFYNAYDDGTFRAHNGWFLLYEGNASQYKKLLIALLMMFDLMYEGTEKTIFWASFKRELFNVNKKAAERLIRDLDID